MSKILKILRKITGRKRLIRIEAIDEATYNLDFGQKEIYFASG